MDQEMDSDTNSSLGTRTQSDASSESESAFHTTTTTSDCSVLDTLDSLSPKGKKRVDSADAPFNKGRCLILNYSGDSTVQYCHMIARECAKDEKLMTALEWHWNMPYKSLHLNTRYNVFFAASSLHLYHDSDAWGLVPEKAIIDQYYDASLRHRSKFPDIQLPQNGFEYRMLPLGNFMKKYPILRQNDHTLPLNEGQFTLHFYPFQNLPPFRSHLHPKFAIYELGRKYESLLNNNPDAANEAISLCPALRTIFSIYNAWKGLPEGAHGFKEWMNEYDSKGDGDRQSETSSKTGYDSLRKGVERKREGNANDPPSAAPAGGNSHAMQIPNTSFGKLSRKSLVKHERVFGKSGWTSESLSNWVADASRHAASDIVNSE